MLKEIDKSHAIKKAIISKRYIHYGGRIAVHDECELQFALDCRAVMEALADCGSIDTEMEAASSEMEVTVGLIQKLVDENATRKLDQHGYRKKYDGYARCSGRFFLWVEKAVFFMEKSRRC